MHVGDKLLSYLLESVGQLGLEEVLLARQRANFTAESNVADNESTGAAMNDAVTQLNLEQPQLSDTYEQIVVCITGFYCYVAHCLCICHQVNGSRSTKAIADAYSQWLCPSLQGASLQGFPEQLLNQIQSNLTVRWSDYAQVMFARVMR